MGLLEPAGCVMVVGVECPPTGVIEVRFDGVVLGDVIDVDGVGLLVVLCPFGCAVNGVATMP